MFNCIRDESRLGALLGIPVLLTTYALLAVSLFSSYAHPATPDAPVAATAQVCHLARATGHC
jgi:hypothetical protein